MQGDHFRVRWADSSILRNLMLPQGSIAHACRNGWGKTWNIYMSLSNNMNKPQQCKAFLTNARQILMLAMRDISLYQGSCYPP
jgi:hypothetical protein